MAGLHRPLLHGAQGRGVQADADSVEVGSPSIYADTHQFGAPAGSFDDGVRWGNIPARPFLAAAAGQVAPAGKDAIREIVLDYLADPVGGIGQGAENRRATT